MKRRFFPAGLNVRGKSCLVIGGDAEASEKAVRLAESGASVAIVSHVADSGLAPARAAGITIHERALQPGDIADQFLVILAIKTDPALTRSVADQCRPRRILLSAIDQPEFCDVVHVSLVQRGHLQVTIATDGHAPALARRLREDLEKAFDASDIAAFVDHLAILRARLEKEEPDLSVRRKRLIAAASEFRLRAEVVLPPDWKKP